MFPKFPKYRCSKGSKKGIYFLYSKYIPLAFPNV